MSGQVSKELLIFSLYRTFGGWRTDDPCELVRPSIRQRQIGRHSVGVNGAKDIFASDLPAIQRVARQRGLRKHCARDH